MTVAVTIRDVPEDVRDALAQYARQQGQSLQAFLLGVLTRQSRYALNQQVLVTVEDELAAGGGAGTDAPAAADVLAAARAMRVEPTSTGEPGTRGSG
ncbi:FitA-like ribbon-helix-helix domain-containing protein [Parafrankia sp. FMc2]|uniref:FitA-like ribbon-helix-helix domain-containing protein n=1 Tax=Parafrankia sp. FMc2 TaxID=3233196 RepID=UPI0034D79FD8